MSTRSLLTVPLEIRYIIFDHLSPSEITVSTVTVDPGDYAQATKLVADRGGINNLPLVEFLKVGPILAASANSTSLSDHGQPGLLPKDRRLVVRPGFHPPLLDFIRDGLKRPWYEPEHLTTLGSVCRQLRAEIDEYSKSVRSSVVEMATVYVTYPLGLLAIRAVRPTLLWDARLVVLAGVYDPSAGWKSQLDPMVPRYRPVAPILPCETYQRASLVVDELVKKRSAPAHDADMEDEEESGEDASDNLDEGDEPKLKAKKETKAPAVPTLELRFAAFTGPQSHARALQAPSPYASAMRGTVTSVMRTRCDLPDDYDARCTGDNCRGRSWVVKLARGGGHCGRGVPAVQPKPLYRSPEYLRILVWGERALRETSGDAAAIGRFVRHWAVRRATALARARAEDLWCRAAVDAAAVAAGPSTVGERSISPRVGRRRIPFSLAMDVAAQAVFNLTHRILEQQQRGSFDYHDMGAIDHSTIADVNEMMDALVSGAREVPWGMPDPGYF
jgi:hypothetical protein